MERASAWLTRLLLVGALAVVAVATLDALRRGPEREAREPSARGAGGAELRERLRDAGVRGALAYIDRDCFLRSLSLPELSRSAGQRVGCEGELAPRLRPGGQVGGAYSADGRPRSGCRRGVVELAAGRRVIRRLRGCAPAAHPDGSLTFARAGTVVSRTPGCGSRPACDRVVLTGTDLVRAARRHPNVPGTESPLRAVVVRDLAWVGGDLLAVLLEAHLRGRLARIEPPALLALYAGRRVAAVQPVDSGIERLAVSPRGSLLATFPGLRLVRRDGTSIALARPFADGHAIAWSPDERWAAVATRASVLLVPTAELRAHAGTSSAPSLVRVPIAVRELAWTARRR